MIDALITSGGDCLISSIVQIMKQRMFSEYTKINLLLVACVEIEPIPKILNSMPFPLYHFSSQNESGLSCISFVSLTPSYVHSTESETPVNAA